MITRESLEGIASKYGVGFRDHTDKVEFYILFNPDFEWHEQSLVLWWEENPNGGLNWWEDWVFDCRHRISGPGYPAYAIFDQKPISEEELLAKIDSMVKLHVANYKQYEHKI